MTTQPSKNTYDAIVIAVAHNHFRAIGADEINSFANSNHVIYDLKYLLDRNSSTMRL